jgi:23S rRNA (uracil1939-C5)-methyltransferase
VIRESKQRWQIAEGCCLTEISARRINPLCPLFARCGGCQLQHLPYEDTLLWKRRWVQEALQRIGGIQTEVQPVLGMADPWRYRNKATLHVQDGRCGYYQENTHQVIPFHDCLLLSATLNAWIRALAALGLSGGMTVRQGVGEQGLIIWEAGPDDLTGLEHLLRQRLAEYSLSIWNRDQLGRLQYLHGAQDLRARYVGMEFLVSPDAFLQVNDQQTEVLYAMILAWADLSGQETVWDLYCGVGTISLLLAQRAAKVVGFEVHPGAVRDAERNALANACPQAEFRQGKVELEILSMTEQPDIVVLDPPRAGAHPQVLDNILRCAPDKLIYVSCDPATLARDLKRLSAGGMEIVKIQPVDMFPWTGHVEAIILLQRLKG